MPRKADTTISNGQLESDVARRRRMRRDPIVEVEAVFHGRLVRRQVDADDGLGVMVVPAVNVDCGTLTIWPKR